MDEAINVFWTNSTASDKVDDVLKKYEDVDKLDKVKGEGQEESNCCHPSRPVLQM